MVEAFIYHLSENGVSRVDYESTKPFTLTRLFVTQRRRMVEDLLAGE